MSDLFFQFKLKNYFPPNNSSQSTLVVRREKKEHLIWNSKQKCACVCLYVYMCVCVCWGGMLYIGRENSASACKFQKQRMSAGGGSELLRDWSKNKKKVEVWD